MILTQIHVKQKTYCQKPYDHFMMSNHYAIHLKLTQCSVSVIAQYK